jgi:hypothetical protein
MRTPDYGKITQFKNRAGGGPLNIPIHFTKKDRWICHRFASPSMANGNWGSEIIVLVDNFGETYHFSENDSGNEYTMTLTSYNKDFSVRTANYRIYDGCSCISTGERSIAFTEDIIDILKATPGIAFGTRKEIDNYINTLVEKNKKILNDIEIRKEREIKYWEGCNQQGQVDLSGSYYNGKDNLEIYMYDFNIKESTKYNGYEVYGSWDDWKNPYEVMDWIHFIYQENRAWIIEIPEKYIEIGKKYFYKLKKDGVWIEPTEGELRIKDENGNWNNVIFIH